MPKKRKQKEQFVDVFPVAPALKRIGGKWKGMIVCRLLFETLRYNELLRSLPGCSQRMLANQLRELQADGIVRRKLFREIPPRVEYSLTDIGRDLLPMIRASCEWSHKHLHGAVADHDSVQCRCLRDLEAVQRDRFRTRGENFPSLQSDVGAGA
jgi:DNA-binding HxlR family transcriptional regulator